MIMSAADIKASFDGVIDESAANLAISTDVAAVMLLWEAWVTTN